MIYLVTQIGITFRLLVANEAAGKTEFWDILEAAPFDCFLVNSIVEENATTGKWGIRQPPKAIENYLECVGCDWKTVINRGGKHREYINRFSFM